MIHKYAVYIFGIHRTIYAALALQIAEQMLLSKIRNIILLPKIFDSITKKPKTLSESEKILAEEKGNSKMFQF